MTLTSSLVVFLHAAAIALAPAPRQATVVDGIVLGRRALGRKMVFVDLATPNGELQTLLKAARTDQDGTGTTGAAPAPPRTEPFLSQPLERMLYDPGASLRVRGSLRPQEQGRSLLVAEHVDLVAFAPSEHGVRHVLEAVERGSFELDDAIAALLSTMDGNGDDEATRALLDAAMQGGDDDAVAQLVGRLQRAAPQVARDAAVGIRKPLATVEAPLDAQAREAAAAAGAEGGTVAAAAALLETPPVAAPGDDVPAAAVPKGGWVVVEGEVCARRRLDGGVTLLELSETIGADALEAEAEAGASVEMEMEAEEEEEAEEEAMEAEEEIRRRRRLHCALHPAMCVGGQLGDEQRRRTYAALVAPGARVRLVGRWAAASGGERARLMVAAVRLVRCSSVQRVVRHALDAVALGRLPADEAAAALRCAYDDDDDDDDDDESDDAAAPSDMAAAAAGDGAAFAAKLSSTSAGERRWLAAELARRLQLRWPAPQHGVTTLDGAARAALEAGHGLRARFPLRWQSLDGRDGGDGGDGGDGQQRQRQQGEPALEATIEAADTADAADAVAAAAAGGAPRRSRSRAPPLQRAPSERARGELSRGRDGSFWATKKRPQLELMTATVAALLRAHPAWGTRPLQLVDIGGGQGFLALHLAEAFGAERVSVQLVDIVAAKLERAAGRADKRAAALRASGGAGLPNLRFVAGDASELAASGALARADVCVGLHACGGLSDLIIAHAVAQGAAFAVCTCCFLTNTALRLPAPVDDGTAEGEGGAAAATIGRDEWLGVPPAELHALLRAAELQGNPAAARDATHTVNAMRAAAAEREWAARWGDGGGMVGEDAGCAPRRLRASLVEFDPKYSPRSCVVVGRPEWGEQTASEDACISERFF